MNDQESEAFIVELTVAFPGFREVAEKHSPDYQRTKAAWAYSWNDIKLAECREVLKTLLRDGGIGYEDYRAPGPFVRRLVMALRNRNHSSEADRADSAIRRASRTDYEGSPMAKALASAIKARDNGMSESECLAMINAALPPANDFDGPRYKCAVCLDRGLVLVWRPDFLAKIQTEKLHRGHTYNVACNCDAGFRINQPKEQRFKMPTYTTSQFCRFHNRTIEQERKVAAEWLAEKRQPEEWRA